MQHATLREVAPTASLSARSSVGFSSCNGWGENGIRYGLGGSRRGGLIGESRDSKGMVLGSDMDMEELNSIDDVYYVISGHQVPQVILFNATA